VGGVGHPRAEGGPHPGGAVALERQEGPLLGAPRPRAYDNLQGNRFRHATTFRRWRPDRRPETCTYAQLEVVVPEELDAVFGA